MGLNYPGNDNMLCWGAQGRMLTAAFAWSSTVRVSNSLLTSLPTSLMCLLQVCESRAGPWPGSGSEMVFSLQLLVGHWCWGMCPRQSVPSSYWTGHEAIQVTSLVWHSNFWMAGVGLSKKECKKALVLTPLKWVGSFQLPSRTRGKTA